MDIRTESQWQGMLKAFAMHVSEEEEGGSKISNSEASLWAMGVEIGLVIAKEYPEWAKKSLDLIGDVPVNIIDELVAGMEIKEDI